MATTSLADGTATGNHNVPDHGQPGLATISFHDLILHAGHNLTVRVYKAGTVPMQAALVCETCGRELRTADNPIQNGTIELRAIAIYIDELGRNRAKPFTVTCRSWAGRTHEIREVIHANIAAAAVQSIMIEDLVNPALFDAFWAGLQQGDGERAISNTLARLGSESLH
ncbi:MAG: hypothetical protein U0X20_16995 [Caldilineaceae bacterium]